ncbi:TIGR02391 family protein [Streptomyces sp. NPDC020807]
MPSGFPCQWVWQGARALWQSGHFREAVTAAARKVNAETQNNVGRRA